MTYETTNHILFAIQVDHWRWKDTRFFCLYIYEGFIYEEAWKQFSWGQHMSWSMAGWSLLRVPAHRHLQAIKQQQHIGNCYFAKLHSCSKQTAMCRKTDRFSVYRTRMQRTEIDQRIQFQQPVDMIKYFVGQKLYCGGSRTPLNTIDEFSSACRFHLTCMSRNREIQWSL